MAYEHGSQYPDRLLEFHLDKKQTVSLHSVKGNYTNYQEANDFNSIWFEIAGANGSENTLAQAYRTFILKYLSEKNTCCNNMYVRMACISMFINKIRLLSKTYLFNIQSC